MLTINNVYKRFGSIKVLTNINLAVAKNTIVGLAGPSGGGKSTLLRCIQKLETIDSGTIICNGQTSFMFQDFQLFPHLTVLQNLIYAPNIQNKVKNHVITAMQILNNLGIEDKGHFYPNRLSGGQKQRVALARSLMMQPNILLCDEPTSGLDVATTTDVVSLLESVRSSGVTMLIASHDLDFLTKIADQIVLLTSGTIAIAVNPKEMQDPIGYLKKYY